MPQTSDKIKTRTNVRINFKKGGKLSDMAQNEYIKVLLYAYPQLPAIAEAIETGVETKAMLSYRSHGDTLTLMEKLADDVLLAERLRILYAKLSIIIAELTDEEAYLLEYKYFRRREQLNGRFAGMTLDCSERTFYRRQTKLLGRVVSKMLARGMTEEWFERDFSEFDFFVKIKRAIKGGRERAVVAKRTKAGLCFQKSDESRDGGVRFPRKTNMATAIAETQSKQIKKICKPESLPSFSSGVESTVSPETEDK